MQAHVPIQSRNVLETPVAQIACNGLVLGRVGGSAVHFGLGIFLRGRLSLISRGFALEHETVKSEMERF